jgi:hypothetical protein
MAKDRKSPPRTAADRAAAYRARKNGYNHPKVKPGPKPPMASGNEVKQAAGLLRHDLGWLHAEHFDRYEVEFIESSLKIALAQIRRIRHEQSGQNVTAQEPAKPERTATAEELAEERAKIDRGRAVAARRGEREPDIPAAVAKMKLRTEVSQEVGRSVSGEEAIQIMTDKAETELLEDEF